MSLHCDATLLVARHGDADYPHAHVLSDDGGFLTQLGLEQVERLARAVQERRIAAIYTSRLERAIESGRVAGALLGLEPRQLDGLEEFPVGDLAGRPHDDPEYAAVLTSWVEGDLDARIPGSESGAEALARYREALQHIADLHRGETVLVLSHGGVMSFVIPRLSANVRSDLAALRFLPNAAPAEVAIGDEGWQVLHWPGTPDKADV
ncbi:histidine phosphatase family protein [Actinomycetota bacterium]